MQKKTDLGYHLMSLLVSNADETGLVISKIHQMILILPVKVIKKSLSYIGISYNHSCIVALKMFTALTI